MPYDEATAERIRKALARRRGFVEKRMFGGIAFMRHGNMCIGAWKEYLILRVGPDQYETALREPYAAEFDMTGRSLRGWVMVAPEGFAEDDQLRDWLERAIRFTESLPKK